MAERHISLTGCPGFDEGKSETWLSHPAVSAPQRVDNPVVGLSIFPAFRGREERERED